MTNNPSRREINRQRRSLTEQQRRISGSLASRYLPKLTPRLPKGAKVDDSGWTVGKQQALRFVR